MDYSSDNKNDPYDYDMESVIDDSDDNNSSAADQLYLKEAQENALIAHPYYSRFLLWKLQFIVSDKCCKALNSLQTELHTRLSQFRTL
ncbi:unnamed protein product, partial [Didymodactylos carnosus]